MTKFLSEEGLRYFYNQIKSKFAPASHNHSAGNITSGTLPITRGGTGQTTAAGVRNALGLGNTTGAVPVANGGTGATNVAAAIKALFGTSAIGSSTKPLYYDGATLKACADSIGGGGIVAALLEQNGYVKFANGLILQWGYKDASTSIVTFNLSFPTTCFIALVETINDGTVNSHLRLSGATNIGFSTWDSATNRPYSVKNYWLALGI